MNMKKFDRLTRRLREVKEAVDHKNLIAYDTGKITLHELHARTNENLAKLEKLWKVCVSMAQE